MLVLCCFHRDSVGRQCYEAGLCLTESIMPRRFGLTARIFGSCFGGDGIVVRPDGDVNLKRS
jgi:hypothetical protein